MHSGDHAAFDSVLQGIEAMLHHDDPGLARRLQRGPLLPLLRLRLAAIATMALAATGLAVSVRADVPAGGLASALAGLMALLVISGVTVVVRAAPRPTPGG